MQHLLTWYPCLLCHWFGLQVSPTFWKFIFWWIHFFITFQLHPEYIHSTYAPLLQASHLQIDYLRDHCDEGSHLQMQSTFILLCFHGTDKGSSYNSLLLSYHYSLCCTVAHNHVYFDFVPGAPRTCISLIWIVFLHYSTAAYPNLPQRCPVKIHLGTSHDDLVKVEATENTSCTSLKKKPLNNTRSNCSLAAWKEDLSDMN